MKAVLVFSLIINLVVY